MPSALDWNNRQLNRAGSILLAGFFEVFSPNLFEFMTSESDEHVLFSLVKATCAYTLYKPKEMFSGQEFWLTCFIIGGIIIIAVCMKVFEKLREPNKQLPFPVQEIGVGDMSGTVLLGNIMRPRKFPQEHGHC